MSRAGVFLLSILLIGSAVGALVLLSGRAPPAPAQGYAPPPSRGTVSPVAGPPASKQEPEDTFSLEYLDRFFEELSKDRYLVVTVRQFVEMFSDRPIPSDKVVVILRHDVDHDPWTMLKIAELERRHNLTSSIYFRTRAEYNVLSENVSAIVRLLASWGFDVGLHYEDLYAAGYNATLAAELFRLDLEIMRSLAPVKTVCAHGNRADMPVGNYEMWELANLTLDQFDLEAECYLTALPIVRSYEHYYFADNMGRPQRWIDQVRRAQPGMVVYVLIHPCYYHG